MKLLIVAFVTLCLVGCQASHKLPPVSGKSEPVNSAEVMQNGI
ncbi:conjugal transfer protein [Escherichia coli]|nr:conjugal transfer protein [Escherichia coli]MCH4743417.1 conjugal transfer protein [Escherichia coli]MCH4769455.1 conjugal transfer protein [Escherichia coli]MCH6458207.1 conjugal transfer protein [Escherichia coli]